MIWTKISFQLVNQLIYMYNGTGFFPFKFMATYIFVMAQCMLSIVFVGVAFGYGLKDSPMSRLFNLENLQINLTQNIGVAAALTIVIVCHAVTAVSIFYDHEEDHKYHDYQGPQGFLFCVLRMIMFFAFCLGLFTR